MGTSTSETEFKKTHERDGSFQTMYLKQNHKQVLILRVTILIYDLSQLFVMFAHLGFFFIKRNFVKS